MSRGSNKSAPSKRQPTKRQLRRRSRIEANGPWLVISGPGVSEIRLDMSRVDSLRATKSELRLRVADTLVALYVPDGHDAAKRLSNQLAPYTRRARIVDEEVYKDACRLRQTLSGRRGQRRPMVTVGKKRVGIRGEYLIIGKRAFRLSEVKAYATAGGNIPLPGRALLQAAIALLVDAAERRDVVEDREVLERRIDAAVRSAARSRGPA